MTKSCDYSKDCLHVELYSQSAPNPLNLFELIA